MDVCDEKVTDAFRSSRMMVKAKNTLMIEPIWINRVAGEFCVFSLSSGHRHALLHDGRVIAVREEPNLHFSCEMSLMACCHLRIS